MVAHGFVAPRALYRAAHGKYSCCCPLSAPIFSLHCDALRYLSKEWFTAWACLLQAGSCTYVAFFFPVRVQAFLFLVSWITLEFPIAGLCVASLVLPSLVLLVLLRMA